jgi:hypothetical protein
LATIDQFLRTLRHVLVCRRLLISRSSTADDDRMHVIVEISPGLSDRVCHVRNRTSSGSCVELAVEIIHSGHEPTAPCSVEPLQFVGDNPSSVYFFIDSRAETYTAYIKCRYQSASRYINKMSYTLR